MQHPIAAPRMGQRAIMASVAAGGAGLFLIGAAIAVFTGRSFGRSGMRQLLLGLAAAAATYLIGHVIGVAVEG